MAERRKKAGHKEEYKKIDPKDLPPPVALRTEGGKAQGGAASSSGGSKREASTGPKPQWKPKQARTEPEATPPVGGGSGDGTEPMEVDDDEAKKAAMIARGKRAVRFMQENAAAPKTHEEAAKLLVEEAPERPTFEDERKGRETGSSGGAKGGKGSETGGRSGVREGQEERSGKGWDQSERGEGWRS